MGGSRNDPEHEEQGGEHPERMPEQQLYQALASAHRRRLLSSLLDGEERTVEELATLLSGWEVTTTGTMHTGADRSKLLLSLLHNHLPRLADVGLIEYDPETGTVQLASLHPEDAAIVRQGVEAERLGGP